MDRKMRLDLLEPEVLAMIFEYVDDTSPRTTISIALTSKYLSSVVRLISHRHKTLHIKISHINDVKSLPDAVKQWATDDALLVNVRTLTVDGYLPRYRDLETVIENKAFWQPLAELLSRFSKLRLLTWNLPAIPVTVLDALHTHQRFAKLRLFNYQPSVDMQPSERDKALAKSPALTHLRSSLRWQLAPGHPNMQETSFRRIVQLAPLEYAGILNRIGDPAAGEPQRKLPFKTSKKRNSTIKVLTLDGYNMSKETLEDWSSVVELDKLENVKCSRGIPELSYFESAATLLPNLKHISLNLRNISSRVDDILRTAVQQYLVTCSPLESLSVWSWTSTVRLDDVLKRHGPTLRSLQLHEREAEGRDEQRIRFTVDQLRDILNSCPLLRDLTIDLERPSSELSIDDGDPNQEYFDALASSKLDHLQIYFDQGLAYLYGHGAIFTNNSGEEQSDSQDDDVSSSESDSNDNAAAAPGADLAANDSEQDADSGALYHDQVRASAGDEDSEPDAKRLKREKTILKPSRPESMESYVQYIWKKVFSSSLSARKLDVKFGEWESLHANRNDFASAWERQVRDGTRFFMVRPVERDDQRGQCKVIVKKIGDSA